MLTDIMGANVSVSKSEFTSREERLRAGSRVLYHQTSTENATRILKSGKMIRGPPGSLGSAIYFAQSPADTHRKAKSKGPILKLIVKLGSTLHLTKPDPGLTFKSLLDRGFDSVHLTYFSSGPEWAVYNFDQVQVLGVVDDFGNLRESCSVKPLCRYGSSATV